MSIAQDTVLWVLLTFGYFLIGYPIFSDIIASLIEEGVIVDSLFIFAANVAPFLPMVALIVMAWKSTQTEESSLGGLLGGNRE